MKRLIQRLLARAFDAHGLAKRLELVDKSAAALFDRVDSSLRKLQDKEKAMGQANYMKGIEFKFYGLSSPVLHTTFDSTYSKQEPFEVNYALFERLIKSDVFEHKLYALRILEKNHKHITNEVLIHLQDVILQNHIYGWALCDTLAKPIRLACLHHGVKLDNQLMEWRFEKDNTWLRRVATVSFVVRAKHGDNPPNYPGFLDKMFELCQECLQYDERFNQLGVGWLLREMYLANATGVNKFIRNNYDSFTRQGLRYAIEKMPLEQRNELLNLNKPAPKKTAVRKHRSRHPDESEH